MGNAAMGARKLACDGRIVLLVGACPQVKNKADADDEGPNQDDPTTNKSSAIILRPDPPKGQDPADGDKHDR